MLAVEQIINIIKFMKRYIFSVGVLLLALVPVPALATSQDVLITTVQTESATSATEEYIELVNNSAANVDITNWHLQYFSATTADFSTPTRNIALKGILGPHASYIVASTGYKTIVAQAFFGATLASAGGHVRLTSGSGVTEVQKDLLGWGTALHAESSPVSVAAKGKVYSRKQVQGSYIDTNNNALDFTNGSEPTPTPNPTPSPTPTPTVEPTTPLLASPEITELMQNPAAPATDQNDEFLELYNPNTSAIDITGYKLQTGTNNTYSYTLPTTILKAGEYSALYSVKTGLVLSNTSGKARLLDTKGVTLAETSAYTKAPAGSSWNQIEGDWQWSTTPTPNAANTITTTQADGTISDPTATSVSKSPKVPKQKSVAVAGTSTSKSAKLPKSGSVTPKTAYSAPSSDKKTLPLNPLLLASVGVLAVGYMLYEYRHDIANKFAQLRRNRSLRRTARS